MFNKAVLTGQWNGIALHSVYFFVSVYIYSIEAKTQVLADTDLQVEKPDCSIQNYQNGAYHSQPKENFWYTFCPTAHDHLVYIRSFLGVGWNVVSIFQVLGLWTMETKRLFTLKHLKNLLPVTYSKEMKCIFTQKNKGNWMGITREEFGDGHVSA